VPSPAEALETIPVSEHDAELAGAAGRLLEACPSCGTLMDVTNHAPFTQVFCPSCGQNLRARKQFNNFKLLEVLGEGGMGTVFKALDCNLNRHVALKILKKELTEDAEGKAKLDREARITASINHPHVVKVFSFGEDHGQFYLAMELVEKGSLDQLMIAMRRVSEAQVLEVGIQIAQGLEAGYEHDLIHRDIKPGNILFADPHTAKLVDFGLAIVMDEEAQVRGEIWGTPYYIAPEKLDNQPEDFRSDIYSLGGTLFHALAGRPPYDAETASMVALKQLKSQPVSLQSFAPDVSSETAYVVNRMLAKNADERYQSYRELIDHLSYARQKLIERAEKPQRPKERVVLETQETKNITAFLSLGVLAVIVIAGIVLYFFRDKFVTRPDSVTGSRPAALSTLNATEVQDAMRQAAQMAANHQFEDARAEFTRLEKAPGIKQPALNWLRMNIGLTSLLAGEPDKAAAKFDAISRAGLYSSDARESELASFFVEVAKLLKKPDDLIQSSITNVYSDEPYDGFALFTFGVHDWQANRLKDAAPLFAAFLKTKTPPAEKWIEEYKPLATAYLEEYKPLGPIEDALPKVKDAAAAQTLLAKAREARNAVPGDSKVLERLDQIEAELIRKGAK